MKRKVAIIGATVIIIILSAICFNNVFAASDKTKNETQSTLVELKERELSSLEDFEETYGSKTYGLTAYILHKVQIYSIPFCFLGIIISIIYKVIIGARHLENAEKGLGMIVAVVTLTIICQVLPLIFALVVKIGRE